MARRNFRTAGRLTPAGNRGLRARAVCLGRGEHMDWHSTGEREELLLGITGRVRVDLQGPRRIRRMTLSAGQSVFLPRGTKHRVVNAFARAGSYVYVTAAAAGRGTPVATPRGARGPRLGRRHHTC